MQVEPAQKSNRGGFRPGAGRPAGRGFKPTSSRHKDLARAGLIEKRLADHFSGAIELEPTQVKAAEILYSRLRPALSSVEVTEHDPRDNADPMALYSQMIAALAANPALLDRLIAAVHAHRATNAQLVVADVPQEGK